MGYIRKNVNAFLLLLIIIILGFLAGLTTYYQQNYKNISISYNEKLDQLNQLNYNLSVQTAQLQAISDELNVKTRVKERFDVLYTNVTSYNEQLNDDLAQTRKELIDTLARLKAAENDLSNTRAELDTVKAALKTQQQYSYDLNLEIVRLKDKVCSLHQRLNESC